MRYFFVSSVYKLSNAMAYTNFGLSVDKYPTKSYLHEKVIEQEPNAKEVLILGITEMKKKDYENFWR